MSVILTDNGSEFSNPKAIEYGHEKNGRLRTQIYYCDAGCPYQKGAIEVNHGLIRRVVPKGTGFNHLVQEDITRMMNHINSYKRKKLNNRSPYETFSFSVWHAHFSHDTPDKRKNQTAFGLQKWRFVFKTGFSDTKTAFRLQICQLSTSKTAFQFTKWHLIFQLSKNAFLSLV